MTSVSVQSFLRDSTILAVTNAAVKLVGFLLLPVYTAALAPDVYGITDMTVNLSWLLSIALSLQVNWGLTSFFYDDEGEAWQTRLVSTVFAFSAVAALVTLLLLPLAWPLAGLLLGDGSYASIVAMGLLLASVILLSTPLETATRMRGRIKALALLNVVRALLTVAVTLAAIFAFRMGASSLVFSHLLAFAVAALLFLADNRGLLSWRAFDPALLKRLLVCSAPLVVTALLVWVNDLSDRYVIAWFRSQGEVGLYGIAGRLNGILYVFAWGGLMAYAPFASANAKDPSSRPRYLISFDLAAMALAALCFFASVFSREIVALMTAPGYHGAYVAVPLLLYGTAFNIMAALVGYSFTIRKTGRNYVLAYSVCAAANLALNLALVPRWGFMAAAFTTFLSYGLLFALTLLISERIFPCGYDVKRLLLALAPLALAYPLLKLDSPPWKALAFVSVTLYVGALYRGRVALLYTRGLGLLRERKDNT